MISTQNLIQAVQNGDTVKVAELIAQGANPYQKHDGVSAIETWAKLHSVQAVEMGADLLSGQPGSPEEAALLRAVTEQKMREVAFEAGRNEHRNALRVIFPNLISVQGEEERYSMRAALFALTREALDRSEKDLPAFNINSYAEAFSYGQVFEQEQHSRWSAGDFTQVNKVVTPPSEDHIALIVRTIGQGVGSPNNMTVTNLGAVAPIQSTTTERADFFPSGNGERVRPFDLPPVVYTSDLWTAMDAVSAKRKSANQDPFAPGASRQDRFKEAFHKGDFATAQTIFNKGGVRLDQYEPIIENQDDMRKTDHSYRGFLEAAGSSTIYRQNGEKPVDVSAADQTRFLLQIGADPFAPTQWTGPDNKPLLPIHLAKTQEQFDVLAEEMIKRQGPGVFPLATDNGHIAEFERMSPVVPDTRSTMDKLSEKVADIATKPLFYILLNREERQKAAEREASFDEAKEKAENRWSPKP